MFKFDLSGAIYLTIVLVAVKLFFGITAMSWWLATFPLWGTVLLGVLFYLIFVWK